MSKISYDITDEREKGRPLRISFRGELRVRKDLAAQSLLSFNNGILSEATAFGKTVVCSYLIAKRKVNTLILLASTDLISQWEDKLNRFLVINEEPPQYKTKTGCIKRRTSVIGTLKGGKDMMTGIIDIQGRTPVILTRYKERIKFIYNVRENADYVFLLYGNNSVKENEKVRLQLKQVPDDKSLILVATGQKIGEGFDFCVMTDTVQGKQDVNAVYDSDNYTAAFEQDLIEAEKEIVIASPQIAQEKIKRFLYLMKPRQEDGIKITVNTENPANISYGNAAFSYELIRQMQEAGIKVKLAEDQVEHFAEN